MDDPWGSPWAADDSLPKIDLPAAPPPVLANGADTGSRAILWDDDDAWGGWNGTASGGNSPGWGRSPGLRPVPAASSRDVSPGPWDKRRSEERIVDSGISLRGNDIQGLGLETGVSSGVALEAQDVWQAEEASPAAEGTASPAEPQTPTRSASPDIPPPGPALRPDEIPEPARQASKVQELVDMYDGIAKQSVSPAEPEPVPPPPRKTRTLENATDDEPSVPGILSPIAIPAQESPEVLSSEAVQNGVLSDDTFDARDVSKGDTITDKPAPRRKEPSVKIPIDLSNLDDLFPSTSAPDTDAEPLPDVIIDDTFSSISERKTWYRISRFGPMRKHDMGNDENYVRMDWAHSTARADTLRIVRRWMEEDSITGRVVLGGRQKGAAGASMFNWDSSAPPVEIGELLGKKKGHSKEASIGSKASKASPTVATFGWSSPAASPTESTFPAAPEPQPEAASEPAKIRPQSLIMPPVSAATKPAVQEKPRPQSLFMPSFGAMGRPSIDQALAPPVASPLAAPPQQPANVDEDDDDDWGEMVSSPTVPTSGGFHDSKPSEGIASEQPFASPFNADEPTISPKHPKTATLESPEPSFASLRPGDVDMLAGVQAQAPQSPTLSTPPSLNMSKHTSSQPPASSSAPIPPPLQSPNAGAGPPPARMSPDDQKDDEIVARILDNLPNLSYMLR